MFGIPEGVTEKEPSLDEINAKVPREIRLSDNGRSSLWVMLALLGGGLLWLGGVSQYLVHQQKKHDALNRDGLDAPGQITKIVYGRGGPHFFHTFQVGGTGYRNDVHWQGGIEHLKVGAPIPVLYLPSDPSVNFPKGWNWWDFGYLFLLYFGGLLTFAGARTAWSLYRDWRLARHGWITEGTVTICVPKKSGDNFMVDYEFRTDHDERVEGSNNNCPDEYKTDSKIRVIYLRRHPNRNDSYPLESFAWPNRNR